MIPLFIAMAATLLYVVYASGTHRQSPDPLTETKWITNFFLGILILCLFETCKLWWKIWQ